MNNQIFQKFVSQKKKFPISKILNLKPFVSQKENLLSLSILDPKISIFQSKNSPKFKLQTSKLTTLKYSFPISTLIYKNPKYLIIYNKVSLSRAVSREDFYKMVTKEEITSKNR